MWLAIGGLLTFLLVPLHLKTIYSGLPAHPLFLHVPVILIPLAATAALALVARPRLVAQHGPWIGAVAVVALATTNLTMGAGSALRDALHLGAGSRGFGGAAGPAALVARHAHAARPPAGAPGALELADVRALGLERRPHHRRPAPRLGA